MNDGGIMQHQATLTSWFLFLRFPTCWVLSCTNGTPSIPSARSCRRGSLMQWGTDVPSAFWGHNICITIHISFSCIYNYIYIFFITIIAIVALNPKSCYPCGRSWPMKPMPWLKQINDCKSCWNACQGLRGGEGSTAWWELEKTKSKENPKEFWSVMKLP